MAADIPSFSQLIPGFDFLQNLAKGSGLGVPGAAGGAAPAMPGFGQWVAPTLNPEELAKRIDELKTVQFWLDSNAKLLGATIQALEVQRMTLSTLKTMNVQMGDLRESMMAQVPDVLKLKVAGAQADKADDAKTGDSDDASDDKPTSAVDPMQWWNALTQQFTQLATSAIKDGPVEAAKQMGKVDLSAFQMPGVSLPKSGKVAASRRATVKKQPPVKATSHTAAKSPARKR